MNKTLLLAGAATALFASHANALDYNQYVSAKLTYADATHDYKWGTPENGQKGKTDFHDSQVWGASFAYGVKVGSMRTELELNLKQDAKDSFRSASAGDVKETMENKFAMLNAYYDISTGTKLTPYVGAGLGFARLKASMNAPRETYSKSKTNLAWQLGAGLAYALSDNFNVDLGYRFLNEGKLTYRDNTGFNKWEAKSHEVLLGVRYAF